MNRREALSNSVQTKEEGVWKDPIQAGKLPGPPTEERGAGHETKKIHCSSTAYPPIYLYPLA
jgi:hypothetical protein